MKRYKHPQHGFTHGYGPLDEARLLANGWTEDIPEPAPEPVEDPPEPEKRKPGRPKKVQQ